MIRDNNVLVFEPKDCNLERMPEIRKAMKEHFNQGKYWISFDIDSLDS
jgi:arginase family enzyme